VMHPFYAAWQPFWARAAATHRFAGHSHSHCGSEGERHGRRWFGGRCGPGGGGHEHGGGHPFGGGGGEFDGDGGGSFGVRRPLRFLAYKLELDERQVAELAIVLDTVKTERAQAEVDQRRTTAAYADLLAGESFDEAAASKVSSERVLSAQRLQTAVQAALGKIHALLTTEQRKRLTYLLRTGALRL
jgi:Spy/CpxP family protein refolding chaperone